MSLSAKAELVFVYVHGFGGAKSNPAFCVNLSRFLDGVPYACKVRNYEWDSVDIDIAKAGANWLEAERNADAQAEKFRKNVIDEYERTGAPYILIGFSIGSRVILRALESAGGGLRMIRGVYFLGSALERDTPFDGNLLPEGMKIRNFHSPTRDKVHALAFSFMKDEAAGGRVGFDDTAVFDNYAVSCTHAHKGIGIHMDYSRLAYSIGYIALFGERVFVPGKTAYNIVAPVGKGGVWWNKIMRMECEIDGQPCMLEIEQHSINADYFRAVAVFADGDRRRMARGNNVHALLDELRVVPPSYWRNR